MYSLRSRLILAFVIATLLPLAATLWITTSLLQRSLAYSTTDDLDRLSRTLETAARQFYQRERETLKLDAAAGTVPATRFAMRDRAAWPDAIRAFDESGEAERFTLSGSGGNRLDYLRRVGADVERFSRDLGDIHMQELSDEFRRTRAVIGSVSGRDLRRGFTLTLLLLVAAIWLLSLAPIVFVANRVTRPIRQLTAGLSDVAAGDWDRRVPPVGEDEVGRAIGAFNRLVEQLRHNRDRLVYLAQMSSWQSLARKTAHELKNSLTPIRLTVEEMLARQPPSDRAFMAEAVHIVVSEIDTLERRVRAFSDFSSEPVVTPRVLDVNAIVTERVSLSRRTHPATTFNTTLDENAPRIHAADDLVKGLLTNLLDNAADAAGPGGRVMAMTRCDAGHVAIEIHDSGSGLSDEARRTLFEPTMTFKKDGMGLGLSIARKHALLSGGDITVVPGVLGGAGFRVVLPAAAAAPIASV